MASIYLITLLLIVSPVFSYIIIKDTSINNDRKQIEFSEEHPITKIPDLVHRQKIPQRGQSKGNVLPEITTFLELAREVTDISGQKSNDNKNLIDSNENNQLNTKSDEIIERKPLSFGDILTVLALWNLANAFNDYNVSDETITEQSLMKSQSNPWPEIKVRHNDNNYLF